MTHFCEVCGGNGVLPLTNGKTGEPSGHASCPRCTDFGESPFDPMTAIESEIEIEEERIGEPFPINWEARFAALAKSVIAGDWELAQAIARGVDWE